jgi:hypothetical protein
MSPRDRTTVTTCNAGYHLVGDQCVPGLCSPAFVCRGNDLHQVTGEECTDEAFVQTCSYACASGACILPPPPSGSIRVSPSLVRQNDTTQVIWSASNVSSCNVTENNPDIADAWTESSGEETSSPITQRTTYTLSCTGIDGSTLTRTATVNLIPVFEEL